MENCVNCWNPKARNGSAKAISSQASQEWVEGSTTRSRSPNAFKVMDSKGPRARRTLLVGL